MTSSNARRQLDRARPEYTNAIGPRQCCDTRQPGADCWACGKGPNDQPIIHNQALASNA